MIRQFINGSIKSMVVVKRVVAYTYLIAGALAIIIGSIDSYQRIIKIFEYFVVAGFSLALYLQYVILGHTIIKYVVPFKVLIVFDLILLVSIIVSFWVFWYPIIHQGN